MSRPHAPTALFATAVSAVLALSLSACGGSSADAAGSPSAAPGTVTVGALSNGAATETTLDVPVVQEIRDELPAEVKESGELVIGVGALPSGFPPLAYVGDDQKTLTGSEPDIGRLVAATLGLEPVLENSTWENLFVGIDSGKTDVGFSNITDTEERQQKYDFACYRKDELALEAPEDASWTFTGDPSVLAGKTIAVASGTNQERILLEWQRQLQAAGQTLDVQRFADTTSTYTALSSGRIDANFGPNPTAAYHVTQTKGTPQATKIVGTSSGAGASLQGLICATSKKDSGLAEPVADALNHLISSGQYAKTLEAWNLSNEAVPTSEINPPGLPLTDQ